MQPCCGYSKFHPDILRNQSVYNSSEISLQQITDEANNPQYLCNMCYRLCELWQGFRDRCQETERKLNRRAKKRTKPEQSPRGRTSARVRSVTYVPPAVSIPKTESDKDHEAEGEMRETNSPQYSISVEEDPSQEESQWIEDEAESFGEWTFRYKVDTGS